MGMSLCKFIADFDRGCKWSGSCKEISSVILISILCTQIGWSKFSTNQNDSNQHSVDSVDSGRKILYRIRPRCLYRKSKLSDTTMATAKLNLVKISAPKSVKSKSFRPQQPCSEVTFKFDVTSVSRCRFGTMRSIVINLLSWSSD